MADPFAPADGVKSRKMHCAELALTFEPKDQILESDVMDLLDCSRDAAYSAMRDAAEFLEKTQQQSVKVYRSSTTKRAVGWVVIGRDEAMLQRAQERDTKAERARRRKSRTLRATDRSQLRDRFKQQEYDQMIQNDTRVDEIRGRRPRPLVELEREASNKKAIPEQRVRQISEKQRREGA